MQLELGAASPARNAPACERTLMRARRLLGGRILFAGAALAALLLLGLFVYDLRTADTNDFQASYAAALGLRHGQRLYDTALAWKRTRYASGLETALPTSAYVYPPVVALALVPLTALPYHAARDLWLALMFGSLAGAGVVLAGVLAHQSRARTVALGLVFAGAAALLAPVRITLAAGQIDTLLLLLLMLALVALTRRRFGRAALLLGVAACVKPFLLFVALFLLWKGAYRAAVLAGAIAAALILLPAVALGPGTARDFLTVLQYFSSATFAVSPHNQALSGMLLRLFTRNPFTAPVANAPVLATLLRYASVGLLLALLAGLAMRRRALGDALDVALDVAMLICVMLLVSPHTEIYHLTYLVPVFAAVAAAVLRGRLRRGMLPALGLAVAGMYLALPGPDSVQYAFHDYLKAPVTMPKLLLTGDLLYAVTVVAAITFIATLSLTRADAGYKYRRTERTS